MRDQIISYIEMCQRERSSLQAGMNFGLGGNHSVILMSLRVNAPYRDRIEGVFHLVDSWIEFDGKRNVFRFKLIAVEGEEDLDAPPVATPTRRRIIPTAVKISVWKRDGGKCVICGATDELHFDHDLPWSKGGTSMTTANVQLLCARHNIQKRDDIV